MYCKNQKVCLKDLLLEEIKHYIEFSLDEQNTGVYWVEFNAKRDTFIILESSYYNKRDLDGYINIGSNKVFFYYSIADYVDTNCLLKLGLDNIPDENSDISKIDFDSYIWKYRINKDGSFTKIN